MEKELEFTYCLLGEIWGPWKPSKMWKFKRWLLRTVFRKKTRDCTGNRGGFTVTWGIKQFGFGELTVVIKNDGTLLMDPEMSSGGVRFAQEVLKELVRRSFIRSIADDGPEILPPKVQEQYQHGTRNDDIAERRDTPLVWTPETLQKINQESGSENRED